MPDSLAIPWSIACQASLSMGFSRQEYWSWLPWPPPGDLPNPGIEPSSLRSPVLAGRFFITSATGEAPKRCTSRHIIIKMLQIENFKGSKKKERKKERNPPVRLSVDFSAKIFQDKRE